MAGPGWVQDVPRGRVPVKKSHMTGRGGKVTPKRSTADKQGKGRQTDGNETRPRRWKVTATCRASSTEA